MLDIFGFSVFDILFKTVLGYGSLGVTRAIEIENGRFLHLDYAWTDPDTPEGSYTANEVVSVQLAAPAATGDKQWHIVDINPAPAELPLTEARARKVIAGTQLLSTSNQMPVEPWILPFSLYAGYLPLPLQETAVADGVEALLLPGLQERQFGILPVLRARRLWRDFIANNGPVPDKPAAWAAAVEVIISEQSGRQATQAGVARLYKTSLATVAPRVRQIKKALTIQKADDRYSDQHLLQLVVEEDE